MRKIVFLNREIATTDNLHDCLVVPLNPVAMRDVLSSGLRYVKVEDHFDFDFARAKKEEIFAAFEQLFGAADGAIAKFYNRYELESFGPFSCYYMYLRLNIEIEAVYYKVFESIVRKYQPSEICLLGVQANYDNDGIAIKRFAAKYHHVLLKELATRENVPFTSILSEPEEDKGPLILRSYLVSTLKTKIFNIAKRFKLLNSRQFLRNKSTSNKLEMKAFFLQTGWGVFDYSQYFKEVLFDTTIIDQVVNNNMVEYGLLDGMQDYYNFLDSISPAMERLSSILGFDATFLVANHFGDFLEKIPKILSQADSLSEYLKKVKPDFIFYTNLDEAMLPIQLALERRKDITRVIKCHGDSIFDFTVWRKNELEPADLYLTEFPELAKYFQKNAAKAGLGTICEYDGIRLNAKKKGRQGKKKKLLYVPWLFLPGLSFEVINFPSPLFLRIQLRILEELNAQDKYTVVYKGLRTNFMDYQFPIPDYIREHFGKIRISHRPLKKELETAECCLLDAPSSSMWEALDMRVPCQSLVWTKFHLRNTGVDFYRRYITFFESDLDVGSKVRSIIEENKFFTITDSEATSLKKLPSEIIRVFQESRRVG